MIIPYAQHAHAFVEADIAYVIPTSHNIDDSISTVLEYIRANPKIHIFGAAAAYNYAFENIDWRVTFPAWGKYFAKHALYKYD